MTVGAAVLFADSCGSAAPPQGNKPGWQAGFWLWRDEYATHPLREAATPVEALYVQTNRRLPEKLPAAREYWLVFRLDARTAPSLTKAREQAALVEELRAAARARGLPVAGMQLDVDCPTGELLQYAEFLRELRKGIRPGFGISITALLDWFRPGTDIGKVIGEVDEFVPQFYDVAERLSEARAIAAPFDAAKWGPVFNGFGKRFRIGLSTFGRIRMVSGERGFRLETLRPIDFGANPAFSLRARETAAKEVVLRYEALREVEIEYTRFRPGDAVEFMIPTIASIAAAAGEAKRVGGFCGGVLFFRWPALDESLTLQPDEVLAAVTTGSKGTRQVVKLNVVDGACAAVHCVDLLLDFAGPPTPEPARYRIRSTTPLEYFLPNERMPARLAGPSSIAVPVPPHAGLGRIALGRAVAAKRAEYTLEEEGAAR